METNNSNNAPRIYEQQVHKEAYAVLGLENKKSELIKAPKLGPCWNEFHSTQAPKLIEEYQKEKGYLGVFCNSESGYWNYLIGAVVEGCENAPKGMMLRQFPESEYIIITHEPVSTEKDAIDQIGRLVGYLHRGEWKAPEGYERYYNPIMFIESYPPEDNGMRRVELWVPIRRV